MWGAIFAAIGLIVRVIDPGSIDPGEEPIVIAGIGAILGFVSGAGFGALLAVAERGKRIRDLSLGRAALWGALATSVWPLLTPADNRMLLFLCPIGAALAATSIAIAKRAALRAAPGGPSLEAGLRGAQDALEAGPGDPRRSLEPPRPGDET
jgi:hypothetical protein